MSIYLDNNGSTKACDKSKEAMAKWIQCSGNPSSSSLLAQASQKMIERTIKYIQKHCNSSGYRVIFTSGASESNSTIIRSIVDSWLLNVGTVPHIITSSIEHQSILTTLTDLLDLKRIELTYVNPNIYGVVNPENVKLAIKPNTCLISIMYANNEIGSINPIKSIGKLAHEHKIPFHTDAVQIFGKEWIDLPYNNIDAMSVSFHKLYGPMGIGLLVISNKLIHGYKLHAQIGGTQQFGMRGGTENVPAIAGAFAAMEHNFHNRGNKNKKLWLLKEFFIQQLSKIFPCIDYKNVITDKTQSYLNLSSEILTEYKHCNGICMCILGPTAVHLKNTKVALTLPSTILVAFLAKRKLCNGKMKRLLEKNRIIVSIGSACNTSSRNASHVLTAIKAPPIVLRGVLRISIGDDNTINDIKTLIKILPSCIV